MEEIKYKGLEKETLVEKLKQSLGAIKKLKSELHRLEENAGPVAVVGMACNFPGEAIDTNAFWDLLINSREGIVDIPADRWDADELYDPKPGTPGKMIVKRGGFIKGIDQFDAQFFNISPVEAEALDPQQRLLLQTTWEAIENAGINADTLKGTQTGVFIGIASPDYVFQRAATKNYRQIDIYDVTGNTPSTASGRISYTFDLKGPNLALDTACSSSLVSIHLACNSLLAGESSVALAGGVNLILHPNAHIIFSKMGALSPEGKCNTFDAAANGFVRSEGCGIVMLKRLKDAERDGDNILAIIKGTSINQDGKSNGLIAPNGLAQQQVLGEALQKANMRAHDIDYIEAHGTGTPLGDPIEIEAINNVYGKARDNKNILHIGSVKTNIGHLESASGIASFIKTVLSLKHRCIPANLNFNEPSPFIHWKDFVKIPVRAVEYKNDTKPMAAGISAFGFSGTNAHVILEAYAGPAEKPAIQTSFNLLLLSAKTEKALYQLAGRYARVISNAEHSLQNFAFTTATGRSHFSKRAAVLGASAPACKTALEKLEKNEEDPYCIKPVLPENTRHITAFLFTGQGCQYKGMGERLYESNPFFKNIIDECTACLKIETGPSFTDIMFGINNSYSIDDTVWAQPAIFIIEYAVAKLWEHWGVKPDYFIGHSIGEYAAACLAGIFSLPDALKMITARGRLMQQLDCPGKMVAIMVNEEKARKIIQGYDGVAVAAVNGDESTVISGDALQMDTILQRYGGEFKMKALNVSHAFHSPLMTPMLDAFKKICNEVTYNEAKLPIVSCVTGRVNTGEMSNANYWTNHVTDTVLFKNGIETLLSNGANVLVETGSEPVLCGLVKAASVPQPLLLVPGLKRNRDDQEAIFYSLGALFVNGFNINWKNVYENSGASKMAIPTYPFQVNRYWLDMQEEDLQAVQNKQLHPLLGRKIRAAGNRNLFIWEQQFDLSSLPYLEDHCIENTIIFPAACYTEMAVSSVKEISKTDNIRLSNIRFEKVFVLKAGEKYALQLQLKKSGEDFEFSIYSRNILKGSETDWIFRMNGIAGADVKSPAPHLDIESIKNRTSGKISGEQFYAQWNEAGNHWKNTFRGIKEIWTGKSEILSLSETPAGILDSMHQYHSHPALMDICGQLIAAGVEGEKPSAFVGKGIGSINLYGHLTGNRFWSYAKLHTPDKDTKILTADVQVFDENGRLLAETENVAFEFIALQSDQVNTDQWLHETRWLPFEAKTGNNEVYRSYLIIGRDSQFTGSLAETFSQQGCRVSVIEDHNDFEPGTDDEQCIIYCPRVRYGNKTEELDELYVVFKEITNIFSKMGTNSVRNPKCWIFTQNAWSGSFGEGQIAAAVWGLAKSLEIEKENNWGGIADIETFGKKESNLNILREIIIPGQSEKQIRISENGVIVPRLRKIKNFEPAAWQDFRKDAAYLITGGLGELGLLTAKWMVEKGARRLLLLSRKGLPPRNTWHQADPLSDIAKQVEAVRQLEKSGASVQVVKADISNEKNVLDWYQDYMLSGYPHIKGIIHAAGNVKYNLFEHATEQEFKNQLHPKILGSIHLKNIIREELDFFVCFSSASSVLPSPGLSFYAAANSFMDAFALSGKNRPQKVMSINWGAWHGVGMIEAAMKEEQPANRLIGLLSPAQGIGILEKIWNAPLAGIAVLPVDWIKWGNKFPSYSAKPFFSDVLQVNYTDQGNELQWQEIIEKIRNDDDALLEVIEKYLSLKLNQLLRLEEQSIDFRIPLTEYGLDSMMAVELKNKIEKELKVTLQVVDLIQGPSIKQLALIIAGKLNDIAPDESVKPKHEQLVPGMKFKLSSGQESLWTLYRMNPESPAYNVAFTTRIKNGLDLNKWKQSFELLVNRHETLRLYFTETADGVYQSMLQGDAEDVFDFNRIDAREWSSEKLYDAVNAAYKKPFHLETGKLLRVDIFEEKSESCVMLISIHHIACDGWSLWLLLDELKNIYASLVKGTLPELAEKSYTYFDFINWHDRMLAGSAGKRLWNFWKAQLEGELPLLNLPLDYPRSASADSAGATFRFDIGLPILEKLRDFSQKESATLYMATLSFYNILLSRYTMADDIIVGSPTSGRGNIEFAEVAGDFINITVIRTKLQPQLSFRAYLKQVRKQVLDTLSHQDFPFPLLVKKLNPGRHTGQTPVFQTLFSFQKPQKFEEIIDLMEGKQVTWGELELAPYILPQQEGQFDITLELIESKKGISGIFKYNPTLLKETTIARMKDHYINLVETLLENPDTPLSHASVHTKKQLDTLLNKWVGPSIELPAMGIHHLFEEQAARVPHDIALVEGDRELTYSELNKKANQLAFFLVNRGLKRSSLAGLCTSRSLNMVISMLAVLKAGAAYVPLDPGFPAERLNFIVADSGIDFLLTENGYAHIFNEFKGTEISLDNEEKIIRNQPDDQSSAIVNDTHPAYLIYTSGSTGKPKGTVITHENVVNFCKGMDGVFGKAAGNLLAVTTLSFDIAVLELIWTLTNGFKVVLQSEDIKYYTQAAEIAGPEKKQIDFSLFYFSSADQRSDNNYNLLIDGAKFADENGFTAVWTPERHFHEFGALFPNPSVTSAALATITKRVKLRAGSVVATLHNPLRIAEEWSVVDNLSNGRVGVAFASGWQVNDFVLAKDNYTDRGRIFDENIRKIKQLWEGGEVNMENGKGVPTSCKIFPQPVQPELPVWITAAGNIETFKYAGSIGANLLTHLLTQNSEELKDKISVYREARKAHGFDPETGHVTLMLHTFVGNDTEEVKKIVYEPFTKYLRSSFDLMKNMAGIFGIDADDPSFAETGMEALMPKAFDRYFKTSSLMGSVKDCLAVVDKLSAIGVNEIGCLIDFGVDYENTMNALTKLKVLQDSHQRLVKDNLKVYSLAENMVKHDITHIQCTPSLMRMLRADQHTKESLNSMKTLMMGGEKLSPELVKEIGSESAAEIYNMYGPTETTIWSSVKKISGQPDKITIGFPICNTQFYILDAFMHPVPEGVPGELFIGGKGVAAGYINRPALTAERFIKNPFAAGGPVLYRTGDLVRFGSDGEIEYIERTDLQVKVNGHRIEVEEIESLINQLPSVEQCAVVCVNTEGRNVLVAYAKPHEGEGISAKLLREQLTGSLPSYMVPAYFSVVDTMPHTANRKINRKELVARGIPGESSGVNYAEAGSDIEKELVEIWEHVLGVKPIGVNDNFFEIGGDSILSVQITARAKNNGLFFTINQLFQYQTIRELATVVKRVAIVHAEQGDVTGTGPLLPVQQWFFEQPMKNRNHYNQAFLLELTPGSATGNLCQAIKMIARHHDVLHSRFENTQAGWVQVFDVVADDNNNWFDTVDISGLDDAAFRKFFEKDAISVQNSLDISTGNVFKTRLYQAGTGDTSFFLMVAHHLVIDGISWRIILDDLRQLLNQFTRGMAPQLPPKTVSFKDWANKIKEKALSNSMQEHSSYWSAFFSHPQTVLPLKKKPAQNIVASTKSVSMSLSDADSELIIKGIHKTYNTQINDILLSALFLTLGKWLKQEQVMIDIEGHGREELFEAMDVSRTIGWFTTMMPVLLHTEQPDDTGTVIKSVKEILRKIPGNGIGYGMLKYLAVHPQPHNYPPNAPVLFNYLGQANIPVEGWKESGIDTGPLYDPQSPRTHMLEVIGIYTSGKLTFKWNYSSALHNTATIRKLATEFNENLLRIKEHCIALDKVNYTPSDFPGLKINQKGLDSLLAKINIK